MKALTLSSSQGYCPPCLGYVPQNICTLQSLNCSYKYSTSGIKAKQDEEKGKKGGSSNNNDKKQSLFSSVAEALDFSQVRSAQDAELLEEARETTRSGKMMNREQAKFISYYFLLLYGALRRKIGGTYKDFFKSYVDVDGQYVEEGWVDKTCKVCGKDTRGEARQVDNLVAMFIFAIMRIPDIYPTCLGACLFEE
ncbi:hypothetical protein Sjap_000900 [Stephania japonica]|uniref:Uncharacterized protein n=1 Tax=Stephania japonica TaxID=461633 RepID=A0AAP0KLI3_9MAGN